MGGEPAAVVRVSTPNLKRQLANAFDAGLYRLAVMSQPPDDAKDLGQALPTGLVSSVSCERPGGESTTHCSVRWQTVSGQPRTTRYLVHLLAGGCFSAGAQPRYPDHRDTTIETFSENPLNALVSADASCS